MNPPLEFCAYEDRPSDFVALKLLALSLHRHAPNARLHLFVSPLPDDVRTWFEARPNVVTHDDFTPKATTWDIKPEILLWLLDHGVERPIWIDSDIIVANRMPRRLLEAPDEAIVTTTEALNAKPVGLQEHAQDLGLSVRCDGLDPAINSCVVRVTAHHRNLLRRWSRILSSRTFLANKTRPMAERPSSLFHDQSVLSALLGSDEYADFPLVLLREGREIAQCFGIRGYRLASRAMNVFRGTPPFVHAVYVPKPWRDEKSDSSVWDALNLYRLTSQKYVDRLEPQEVQWMRNDPAKARFLRHVGLGNPELTSLPIALKVQLTEPDVFVDDGSKTPASVLFSQASESP